MPGYLLGRTSRKWKQNKQESGTKPTGVNRLLVFLCSKIGIGGSYEKKVLELGKKSNE